MCGRYGVADRCDFAPGDYHQLELEPGTFDLVIMGHILRNEGHERGRSLLVSSHRALRPGGRVLVADYFVAEDQRGPPQALLLGVTMTANTTRGSVYRKSDIAGWMAEAGFHGIRSLESVKNNHILLGEKGAAT